jgi:hypothetical protein
MSVQSVSGCSHFSIGMSIAFPDLRVCLLFRHSKPKTWVKEKRCDMVDKPT